MQQQNVQRNRNGVDNEELAILADADRWGVIGYSEQYILRKETIGYGNEAALKKLSKQSNIAKVEYRKKMNEAKDNKAQFEYESFPIKKQFSALRDIYSKQSESGLVLKKNLQKLKSRVDKVTKQIKLKDAMNLKDSDLSKTIKSSSSQTKPPPTKPPTQQK